MYHDVPRPLFPFFESHIKWLVPRFEFLKPSDLLGETRVGRQPKALLTFDDGCVDNYELVAPLLESHGLRGLFFVCPGFAGLSREASFELMERSSLLLGEKTRDSRWHRMSSQQIVDLDRRGHGIGNHTMTHIPLTKIDEREAVREVEYSATTLASWLGHPSPFFAWTYSWNEITPASLAVALKNHSFCFSPCCGVNDWPLCQSLHWRTGVDVSKPISHLQTQISGLLDYMYRRQRLRVRSILKSVLAQCAI
jgi:peptidoglycan/xylan/chitin deacetylase (PgdA/CDA1 family)